MAYLLETNEATKQCADCGLLLSLSQFTPSKGCRLGVLPQCRPCARIRAAAYRAARPDVHRAASARWRSANPEHQRRACKEHYHANKEYYADKSARWRLANPDKCRAHALAHHAKNPERRRESWRLYYHAHKLEPLRVIRRRVTSRMHAFLRGRRAGVMREIGCDPESLRRHLELLFSEGMGWHNSADWEIDHFYPLAALGENPEWLALAAVCNYRNLRPCWKTSNRSKRAVILPEAERLHVAIRQMIAEGHA